MRFGTGASVESRTFEVVGTVIASKKALGLLLVSAILAGGSLFAVYNNEQHIIHNARVRSKVSTLINFQNNTISSSKSSAKSTESIRDSSSGASGRENPKPEQPSLETGSSTANYVGAKSNTSIWSFDHWGTIPSLEEQAVSVDGLLSSFRAARHRLYESLRADYGDYMEALFFQNSTSLGRKALVSELGLSWKRWQRKLQMKLLQVQIRKAGDKKVPFVWAIGGNSVAAGHGNLFNQSYTAYLEGKIADVLSSLGMYFEGRNYAMGGTLSGPEIALCIKEIYGLDIDALAWDFGLVSFCRFQLVRRAALSTSHLSLSFRCATDRPEEDP
jgi:hypothetical protein